MVERYHPIPGAVFVAERESLIGPLDESQLDGFVASGGTARFIVATSAQSCGAIVGTCCDLGREFYPKSGRVVWLPS